MIKFLNEKKNPDKNNVFLYILQKSCSDLIKEIEKPTDIAIWKNWQTSQFIWIPLTKTL